MSHDPRNPRGDDRRAPGLDMGPEPGIPEHTLQAYVDGELTEAERSEVALVLERSAAARAYVREQQEVRTLLRHSGPRPAAPATLRVRIAAGLDDVDAARGGASAPPRFRALRAVVRGAMVMAPAAAAAVGLFFVVQSGALTDARGPGPSVAVLGTPTHPATERTPNPPTATRSDPAPEGHASLATDAPRRTDPEQGPLDLTGLEGFDFSGGFEAPTRLPEGVTLVSADRHGANNASSRGSASASALEVSYVDRHTGGRLVDVQRPLSGLDAAAATARADELTVRRDGVEFWLRRDAAGRAHLRFHDGRVEHALRHHGGTEARVGAPVLADDPGFATLLELALTIRKR